MTAPLSTDPMVIHYHQRVLDGAYCKAPSGSLTLTTDFKSVTCNDCLARVYWDEVDEGRLRAKDRDAGFWP